MYLKFYSMASEQRLKKDWYDKNAPLGHLLGYPECCIKAFCDQPPELLKGEPTIDDMARFGAAHVDKVYTGFIPCIEHANQILKGQITLESLITERDPSFGPFPNA